MHTSSMGNFGCLAGTQFTLVVLNPAGRGGEKKQEEKILIESGGLSGCLRVD